MTSASTRLSLLVKAVWHDTSMDDASINAVVCPNLAMFMISSPWAMHVFPPGRPVVPPIYWNNNHIENM
jgi:hypothetical protein